MVEEQCSFFQIEGYNMFLKSRSNQKGGGVALYTYQNLKSKLVNSKCLVLDNIMECVTVESNQEKL